MSDHNSGPRALADPVVDITDVYAFPSPEQPGFLVLALNVFPNAEPAAQFSDAVDYRFRLRPVTIPRGTTPAFVVGEKEYTFSFRFAGPVEHQAGSPLAQEGTCTASTGQTASFRVNDEQGGKAHGLRAFAGRRMDPFFFDGVRAAQTIMTRQLAFVSPGDSRQYRQNVLSIVVELDIATTFGADAGPLFAVVGETMIPGPITVRLERFGRPLMKSVVLGAKDFDTVNRDLDIRDLYNQEDPYNLGPTYLGAYRARMNANLGFWDSLDHKIDWPPDAHGTHPLTELLLADFMVIDVSKPYAEDSYFEIERALLNGASHQSCGGRSLNDDVGDTIVTTLINAGNGARISDGVDQQAVRASRTFPYLVPPELNPPAKIELSLDKSG
ncbi:DUF4331 domain-containing protein [Nocardia vinacea]|uniref:DUF4331 domain-containing protein n=1 Tax=Nocardia vinacea TaxID=96468 RepID=A0ABZ1YS55_9NOCA|nr:DUF4331 domain-containing protein [Nocardia vinacea]